MPVHQDGRAAGTPEMVLLRDVGLSTGIVQLPGAILRTTEGENHNGPGASRELEHPGNYLCSPVQQLHLFDPV